MIGAAQLWRPVPGVVLDPMRSGAINLQLYATSDEAPLCFHNFGLRLRRGLCYLAGPVRQACGQSGILCLARADDRYAFVIDNILADVFAVIATSPFDHNDDFAKLPFDLHITQPDDVV